MASDETFRPFDPWRVPPVHEDSREQILDSYYFQVDKVRLHAAKAGSFDRTIIHTKRGETVGIFAIGGDGKIPFIEQYRIPTHRWTLEIPAGHETTPNSDPMQTAHERLRAEAGLTAHNMRQIIRFINTPSYSTHYTSIFLATGLRDVSRELKGVDMRRSSIRWLTLDEAYNMVLSGSILDAKTVIAVLRAKTRLSATDLDVLADISNRPFEGEDFDGSADESDAQIREALEHAAN